MRVIAYLTLNDHEGQVQINCEPGNVDCPMIPKVKSLWECLSPIQSPNSNLSIKSPKYKAPIKYINLSNF